VIATIVLLAETDVSEEHAIFIVRFTSGTRYILKQHRPFNFRI
jgi:hypothetical protein